MTPISYHLTASGDTNLSDASGRNRLAVLFFQSGKLNYTKLFRGCIDQSRAEISHNYLASFLNASDTRRTRAEN